MRRRLIINLGCLLAIAVLLETIILDGILFDTRTSLNIAPASSNRARYDFYRLYRIELETSAQAHIMQQLEDTSDSYIFYGNVHHVGQNLTVLVAAHKIAEFTYLLKTFHIGHKVMTYDFQTYINHNLREVLPSNVLPNDIDWKNYFHLDTIYDWLQELSKAQTTNITLLEIGHSAQGLPIRGIKLAHNNSNKAIVIAAGRDAQDWLTPSATTNFINELLTTMDPCVKYFAQHYNWIIFPILSPDAYKNAYTSERSWRKRWHSNVKINHCAYNSNANDTQSCLYDFVDDRIMDNDVGMLHLLKYLEKNVMKEQITTYFSLRSVSQLNMSNYNDSADAHVQKYDNWKYLEQRLNKLMNENTGRVYHIDNIYETIDAGSNVETKDKVKNDAVNISMAFTFQLKRKQENEKMFIMPIYEYQQTAIETLDAMMTIIQAENCGYYK